LNNGVRYAATKPESNAIRIDTKICDNVIRDYLLQFLHAYQPSKSPLYGASSALYPSLIVEGFREAGGMPAHRIGNFRSDTGQWI
jgi:hypothetical protein